MDCSCSRRDGNDTLTTRLIVTREFCLWSGDDTICLSPPELFSGYCREGIRRCGVSGGGDVICLYFVVLFDTSIL